MDIKMLTLSSVALAAFGGFCLTNDGQRLKTALQLDDFTGPTNRYVWVCPSNVTISNLTFTTGRIRQRGGILNFDLLGPNDFVVGGGEVETSPSAKDALDAICDRLMLCCSAPVETVRSARHVERDNHGNVILKGLGRGENGGVVWDRGGIFRTYGNLYVNIFINTNRTSLSALDFALPLIHAGLQTR